MEATHRKQNVNKMVEMVVNQSEECMKKTESDVKTIKKRDEQATKNYINNKNEKLKSKYA